MEFRFPGEEKIREGILKGERRTPALYPFLFAQKRVTWSAMALAQALQAAGLTDHDVRYDLWTELYFMGATDEYLNELYDAMGWTGQDRKA